MYIFDTERQVICIYDFKVAHDNHIIRAQDWDLMYLFLFIFLHFFLIRGYRRDNPLLRVRSFSLSLWCYQILRARQERTECHWSSKIARLSVTWSRTRRRAVSSARSYMRITKSTSTTVTGWRETRVRSAKCDVGRGTASRVSQCQCSSCEETREREPPLREGTVWD